MESETLRGTFRFFDSLADDEIDFFLNCCEKRTLADKDILFSEGDNENFVAFLVRGKIIIKKKSGLKGNYTVVGIFDKGSVVGELCLLTDNPRTVTAQAREHTDLIILTSSNFEKLLGVNSTLGIKLLKQIFLITSKRLKKSYDRIASIF